MNIPELLAPVGGMPQLRAAVQNGADAVYMGGSAFNARAKAENFTKRDIEEAIVYAHDRDVKVYVTLNTLIKDSELFDAFSYGDFLRGIGADGIIVQDMGLARLIKKYLPDMPMHMSTQGTLYNRQAVSLAKKLGFSRIVPARELTLDEIRAFAEECHGGESPCQVEVFVHGALCVCYSGQCHMSRVIGKGAGASGGNRSGNRGTCAQPCRLAYKDSEGTSRYLLSPKDICGLGSLPEICEAGVDSLKIEGRLKSPQYVAVVTSVYRKYLDIYEETGRADVAREDAEKLLQIFNRGGFTTGYLEGNPGSELLSGESPKNAGVYVGRVRGIKKGSTLIDVDVEANSLSMGDGVEIRGKDITGNVISYIRPLSGGMVRIGDIKGNARTGDAVFKVTDKALMTAAEKSYGSDLIRKVAVRERFTARVGEAPVLEMTSANGGEAVAVKGKTVCEVAERKPLDATRAEEQLRKLGNTVFEAKSVAVDIKGEPALPVSVINDMRREAAELLLEARRGARGKRSFLSEERKADIKRDEALGDNGIMRERALAHEGIFVYSKGTVEMIAGGGLSALRAKETRGRWESGRGAAAPRRGERTVYIPLVLFMDAGLRARLSDRLSTEGATLVPYVINVSKGNEDIYINENFDEIARTVKESGIMLGNLGWIERFRDAGVTVYGGYGLNVYNGQSVKAFEEMGVDVRAYSHEADEFYRGRIPLMITEHPVTSDSFIDRKGAAYSVMRWYSGDKFLIFGDGRSANGGRGGDAGEPSGFIEYIL